MFALSVPKGLHIILYVEIHVHSTLAKAEVGRKERQLRQTYMYIHVHVQVQVHLARPASNYTYIQCSSVSVSNCDAMALQISNGIFYNTCIYGTHKDTEGTPPRRSREHDWKSYL